MQNTKKEESILEKVKRMLNERKDFFMGDIYRESIEKTLEAEVAEKAGQRYEGGKQYSRWGRNPGSITANGERIKIEVPRIKEKESGKTSEPEIYKKINKSIEIPVQMIRAIINGLSQRRYRYVVKQLTESFGLSQSVISRKFRKYAERVLKDFMERDLGVYEFVAIIIDGKYLGREQIVHAVGITSRGDKVSLGFIQTTTENGEAIKGLLKNLINRHFKFSEGILVVCDGSKGIRKGVDEVFGEKGVIQRCQWHKRENVVSYLPDRLQKGYKAKLRNAYAITEYEKAKVELNRLAEELGKINPSAQASVLEGLEETLTLHRLGLKAELGESLSTTNIIESINSQLESKSRNVKRWRPGKMRAHWVCLSLLEIEKTVRRVRHYNKLHLLKLALAKVTKSQEVKIA